MYERFADKAREAMQLANQEAQKLCHEYIGTEHILLGLLKGGEKNPNEAVKILNALDINIEKVRIEIKKIVQSGPEMVVRGKLPQTPRAKKVIEYAIEEARNFNHDYVGTQHLLLGLLREEDGCAAQCLRNCGVKLEEVRIKILELFGGKPAEKNELELERRPILPSSIQQMKDMAGLSDMPNTKFVAWFQRLVSVCKNLRLITEAKSYDEYLGTLEQQPVANPTATLGLVNDRNLLG